MIRQARNSEIRNAGDARDAALPVLIGSKRGSKSLGHLGLSEAQPEPGLFEFGVGHINVCNGTSPRHTANSAAPVTILIRRQRGDCLHPRTTPQRSISHQRRRTLGVTLYQQPGQLSSRSVHGVQRKCCSGYLPIRREFWNRLSVSDMRSLCSSCAG